jgi:hypothetical protein
MRIAFYSQLPTWKLQGMYIVATRLTINDTIRSSDFTTNPLNAICPVTSHEMWRQSFSRWRTIGWIADREGSRIFVWIHSVWNDQKRPVWTDDQTSASCPIQKSIPQFVYKLIQSGLSIHPYERPTMEKIIENLARNSFRIVDEVESKHIFTFVNLAKLSELWIKNNTSDRYYISLLRMKNHSGNVTKADSMQFTELHN